jgi:hypothetical protein
VVSFFCKFLTNISANACSGTEYETNWFLVHFTGSSSRLENDLRVLKFMISSIIELKIIEVK